MSGGALSGAKTVLVVAIEVEQRLILVVEKLFISLGVDGEACARAYVEGDL